MADGSDGSSVMLGGLNLNVKDSGKASPGPQYPVMFPHDSYAAPQCGWGMGGTQIGGSDKNASEWFRYSQVWIVLTQVVAGTWTLVANYIVNAWEAGGANVGTPATGAGAIGSNIPYGQSLVETDSSKQGATVGDNYYFMAGAVGCQLLKPFTISSDPTVAPAKGYDPVAEFYGELIQRAIAENLSISILFPDGQCNTIMGRLDAYGVHAGIQGGKVQQIGRGEGYSSVFPLKRASFWGSRDATDKPIVQVAGPPVPVNIPPDPTMPIPATTNLVVPVQLYAYGPRIRQCAPACSPGQIIPA